MTMRNNPITTDRARANARCTLAARLPIPNAHLHSSPWSALCLRLAAISGTRRALIFDPPQGGANPTST